MNSALTNTIEAPDQHSRCDEQYPFKARRANKRPVFFMRVLLKESSLYKTLNTLSMLKYCPNPAFDGIIALPVGCKLEEVVKGFTEDYKLYDFREWLWKLAHAALTHDDFDSDERADVIHFLERAGICDGGGLSGAIRQFD